jgi:hypothetical protein
MPHKMLLLKQLEDENCRLNKIVADLTLDREVLQDLIRINSKSLTTPSRKLHRTPSTYAALVVCR